MVHWVDHFAFVGDIHNCGLSLFCGQLSTVWRSVKNLVGTQFSEHGLIRPGGAEWRWSSLNGHTAFVIHVNISKEHIRQTRESIIKHGMLFIFKIFLSPGFACGPAYKMVTIETVGLCVPKGCNSRLNTSNMSQNMVTATGYSGASRDRGGTWQHFS